MTVKPSHLSLLTRRAQKSRWALAWFAVSCASAGTCFALPARALIDQPTKCAVGSIDLKTGVDETSNTFLSPGAVDQSWTVLSDPDPGTTEPRPATVIPPYPSAWSLPFPGTQYLSYYPTSTNDLNGIYKFETFFCLRPGFHFPKLKLDILADDVAEVFLNGHSLGQTTGLPYNFVTPTTLTATIPAWFHVGPNSLQVVVNNTGNVAMGFDMSATLKTKGLGVDRPACCNTTGSLSGRKWNDLNGDGVKQSHEPTLSGWLIKLSNGATTWTDSNGYYYFVNLPAGLYTVAEQAQAGWQQTSLPATHTILLAPGQGVNNLDFGNRRCPQCMEGQVVFVPAGGPAAADLCARLCCKRGEFFFQNSCGCGCSTKPPCPDPGTPGIRYVSRDPAFCAAARFICKSGEEFFSNECGCGCRSTIVLPDSSREGVFAPIEPSGRANPENHTSAP
jgi:hypothetical protein